MSLADRLLGWRATLDHRGATATRDDVAQVAKNLRLTQLLVRLVAPVPAIREWGVGQLLDRVVLLALFPASGFAHGFRLLSEAIYTLVSKISQSAILGRQSWIGFAL